MSEKNHDEEKHPDVDDFYDEEEAVDEKASKRRRRIVKLVAIAISFAMVIQLLNIWFQYFNVDSLDLLRTSKQLSEEESLEQLKHSVVTIQTDESKGTGFLISSDGYILTNEHVVAPFEQVVVTFYGGQKYVAQLMEANEQLDVALLKITVEDAHFLPLSEVGASIGESVYVIGNPLMHSHLVNEGEIIDRRDSFQQIRISAPIFRGHSGSPVLSERGEVIGIVYAKTIPSLFSDEQSVGLAIPIEVVMEQIESL